MSRKAREKSCTGIYHIMLRGANRQEIFYDEEDNLRFLETLKRFKDEVQLKVYGWCIMGNHVHLLICEGVEDISTSIKRIEVSYAWYYNWKYRTTGHLFQDRFKSENVENDSYLLAVVRYIHQNPVKAGMVKSVEEWNWSSLNAYIGKSVYPVNLLDKDFLLDIFSLDREKAIQQFRNYGFQQNEDEFLEDKINIRFSDEEAIIEIKKVIGKYEIAEIKSLVKKDREKVLSEIKKIKALTLRQASRILGISTTQLFKA